MKLTDEKNCSTSAIGEAGAHFVCSELWLKGWQAFCTPRNTRSVDVICVDPGSKRHWTIQVKCSERLRNSVWMLNETADADFYAFVRRIETHDLSRKDRQPDWHTKTTGKAPKYTIFEVFLVETGQVRKLAKARKFSLHAKGERPESWRKAWQEFTPDGLRRRSAEMSRAASA